MLYNYISKYPTGNKHRACSHMFQPGRGFSKYHQNKDIAKPRDKPAKYLGNDPFAALSQVEGVHNSFEDANNEEGDNDQDTNNDQEINGNQKGNEEVNRKLKKPHIGQDEYANKIEKSNHIDQDAENGAIKNASLELSELTDTDEHENYNSTMLN